MKAAFVFVVLFIGLVFAADLDGDGYDSDPSEGAFQDCCDTVDDGCFDPFLVNPGAWEVPNNGQADRCIEGRDILNFEGCDDFNPTFPQVGPTVEPSETEEAILAMDICEFKDDDDDPSWGFARQDNLVYSLVDGTRNGFDIGVIGPDEMQAEITTRWGLIAPSKGEKFLSMASTAVFDVRNGFTPVSDDTSTPNTWRNNPSSDPNVIANCGPKPTNAVHGIMATFTMVQPTNMNAWSLKTAMGNGERSDGNFLGNGCDSARSYSLVLANGPVATPNDGNVALDSNGFSFRTNNPALDFFTMCNEYGVLGGRIVSCPQTDYKLDNTPLDGEYATDWITVGTSATAGSEFEIQLATFNIQDDDADNFVFYDDYLPIAEARTYQNPWGYQFTSDIKLEAVRPDINGLYPASTTSVTLSFTVTNYGPERAGDITINFTPPKGTSFASFNGAGWSSSLVGPAAAPYEDNGFYKAVNTVVLGVDGSVDGSVTFNVLPDAPRDLQFKLSATCSSRETYFKNNYQIQAIYIDK